MTAFLEVAIGLCFLFVVMSMTATALREVVENFMKSRAADLERGIREILGERIAAGATKDFYEHPLIASLYGGDYKAGSRTLPSYIPREHFALAVLDLASKASETGEKLSMSALRETLAAKTTGRTAIDRMILTAIDVGGGELAGVRKSLEGWYDGAMDRVSGWYARRTGRMLLAFGLAAAAIGNVDAITIATRLFNDAPLRQAIVAQAEAYRLPENEKPEDAEKRLDQLQTRVAEIGFPVGWARTETGLYGKPQNCTPKTQGRLECAHSVGGFVTMVFGWLVTALAVSLGAPFWFDLMNRFMVVRSTVKPKEKSPDEPAVDGVEGRAASPAPEAAAPRTRPARRAAPRRAAPRRAK